MNRYQKLLIFFEMPLTLIIVWQAWSKPFQLWVYLVASAFLGLIIAVSILKQHQHRAFTLVQMILLGLLVRNIYFIATQYSVIPYGDAYTEYALTRTYLQENAASVIYPEFDFFTSQLSMYSGWPGLSLIAVSLSLTTNVAPLYISVLLPQLFFLGWFVLAYCLLRRLEQDLSLSSLVTNLALLVMATSPFLFNPPGFYHQQFGVLLLMGIFYLIYRQLSVKSASNIILLILSVGSVIIVHHYTSFIGALYVFLFSVIVFAVEYFGKRAGRGLAAGDTLPNSFFRLSLIMIFAVFVWWDNFATVIWPSVGSRITAFIDTIKLLRFQPGVPFTWEFKLPQALAPAWAPVLLYLRDGITYVATLLGFVLLWRKVRNIPAKFFILFSVLIAAVPLGIDATFGLGVGLEYRGIFLFMPFIAVSAGIFYHSISNNWKPWSTVLLVVVIMTFVFTSLTGMWAHRYILAHLYDPAVSWVEAGEHPTEWKRLQGFFDEHMTYEDLDQILTEDWYPLSLILPLEQCANLQVINFQEASLSGETVTVAFRDLNTTSYMLQSWPTLYDFEFDEEEFRQEVTRHCNLIYSSSWGAKIWRGSE